MPLRAAAAASAVPAGRIGYDLDADVLLLHTIQPASVVEALFSTGMLRADPALIDSPWPEAYEWMNRMMSARLPTEGDAALWLWARIRRSELITLCRRARGDVLLTCRVPRERVLLSHFMEWHGPLNSALVVPPVRGESAEEYSTRVDRVFDDFYGRLTAAGMARRPIGEWPESLREEVERSWDAIFDVPSYPRFDSWQATVHELIVGDVVDAVLLL